ncbi:MAG: ELM1/GtrOC1 family putative glycosyltransferase, partial [Planctomycetota bacterium]|nr:ELM1/GtrOC1 family putative glycosyltransferase [Planctomycetota bacterium]
MPKPLNILAFFDTRPGHQFQTWGVLSALSSLTKVSIRERYVGQNTEPLGDFQPDLLLGAGRRVHVPMLRAKIKTKARSVVLMRPTLWTFGYDLAVVPNHDRMKS